MVQVAASLSFCWIERGGRGREGEKGGCPSPPLSLSLSISLWLAVCVPARVCAYVHAHLLIYVKQSPYHCSGKIEQCKSSRIFILASESGSGPPPEISSPQSQS